MMAQTHGIKGGDELWLDSECILKAEPTVFSGRVDIGSKRKRADKNDCKFSDLSIGKLELASTET